MVLAGDVPLVRPLGVEDAGRRHQEDAEKAAAHAPSDRVHRDCALDGLKIPPGTPAVNCLSRNRVPAGPFVLKCSGEPSRPARKDPAVIFSSCPPPARGPRRSFSTPPPSF